MMWIDLHIFFGIMLITLLGTLFLALIPKTDYLAQEKAVRFFSLATILLLGRLGYTLWRGLLIDPVFFQINIAGFDFKLLLVMKTDKFFLFLLLSLALFYRVFFYNYGEKQGPVSFLLGHMLLFSLGFFALFFAQAEQSLLFLSISTLVVSAMISQSQKAFRGSAIYQSAIFLYTIDASALLLLHIPALKNLDLIDKAAPILLLLPGLSRMLTPFFSPWGKNFIKNSQEKDLAFITSFFALTGYSFLLDIKGQTLAGLPSVAIAILSSICVLSAIYSGLTALLEKYPQFLCFHFFSYYTALTLCLFFAPGRVRFAFLDLAVLSTGLICFLSCHTIAHQITKNIADAHIEKKSRVLWFASLCLLIGTPGLGTGTALWPALYGYVGIFLKSPSPGLNVLLLLQLIGWFIGLLLLAGAVVSSIRVHIRRSKKAEYLFQQQLPKWHFKRLWISHIMVNLICWLIPFYLFSQQ
jgi:hypothetical protein